jgi:hypothetical protein
MKKYLLKAFLLSLIVFHSKEAHVSRVVHRDSNETIASLCTRFDVVKVTTLNSRELLREVKFPKNTHHKKEQETVYKEFVEMFLVEEVLKSKTIKKGQTIKVLRKPAYDHDLVKRYHEEGVSKSLLLDEYKTKSPINSDLTYFMFLHHTSAEVYVFYAEEGLASEAEIKQAITR